MLVLTFRVAEVPYAVAVPAGRRGRPPGPAPGLPARPGRTWPGSSATGAAVVPVVNLGLLMGGAACRDRLDTRIILVNAGRRAAGWSGWWPSGSTTSGRSTSRAGRAGLEVGAAPYLGAVFEADGGLLQLVEPGRVLGGPGRPPPGRRPMKPPGVVERLLADRIGLDPASVGEGLIARGVRARMAALGIRDRGEYERVLAGSAEELQALVEEVVVPESWFFRDARPFEVLRDYARAGWLADPSRPPLSALSVPCAAARSRTRSP